MRNTVYLFVLSFCIAQCNVEGVSEKEQTVEKVSAEDTISPVAVLDTVQIDSSYLVKDDGFAPEEIDYDTVFRFAAKKPLRTWTTTSGVKVEVIAENFSLEKIKKGQVVSVAYQGKLRNGKVIETTGSFGKRPLPFYPGIGMTLEAFDEVLLGSRPGDRVRFTVPSDKAYGRKGHGKLIPPNSDLIYEMAVLGNTRYDTPAKGVRMYYVIKNPLAPEIREGEHLNITYMGWTEGGKLFDASVFHGKEFEIDPAKDKMIKGWEICLSRMRKGEKCLVYVPASLGYGAAGVPEMVPPNSNLVYILELKGFN